MEERGRHIRSVGGRFLRLVGGARNRWAKEKEKRERKEAIFLTIGSPGEARNASVQELIARATASIPSSRNPTRDQEWLIPGLTLSLFLSAFFRRSFVPHAPLTACARRLRELSGIGSLVGSQKMYERLAKFLVLPNNQVNEKTIDRLLSLFVSFFLSFLLFLSLSYRHRHNHFIHSFIHSCMYSFIHSSIHASIHSFIHACIHPSIEWSAYS